MVSGQPYSSASLYVCVPYWVKSLNEPLWHLLPKCLRLVSNPPSRSNAGSWKELGTTLFPTRQIDSPTEMCVMPWWINQIWKSYCIVLFRQPHFQCHWTFLQVRASTAESAFRMVLSGLLCHVWNACVEAARARAIPCSAHHWFAHRWDALSTPQSEPCRHVEISSENTRTAVA